MTQNDIIKKVASPIIRPVTIMGIVSVLAIVLSPIIWIWYTWLLALKVALTGIFLMLILSKFSDFVKKSTRESVIKAIDDLKKNEPKSRFMERIEKLMQE